MLCYRDMTFCPYWRECGKGDDCHRAITPEVEYRANQCALPIAQFTDKPECFELKEGSA